MLLLHCLFSLQITLIATSSTRIRLACGAVHLDMELLNNNLAALEACVIADRRNFCVTMEQAPLFVQFWQHFSDHKAIVVREGAQQSSSNNLGNNGSNNTESGGNGANEVSCKYLKGFLWLLTARKSCARQIKRNSLSG